MNAASIPVDQEDDGIRVDRWFKRHHSALTHGALEKLLRTGQVRVDGKRAKASDRVSTGQLIPRMYIYFVEHIVGRRSAVI